MDMSQFNMVIASTECLNSAILSTDYNSIGMELKSRLEKCIDIRNSIDNFLRNNFVWIVNNAHQYEHSYDTFRLGGESVDYPIDYRDKYDIEIETTKNEDGTINYKSFKINHINEDNRNYLRGLVNTIDEKNSISSYEYAECTAFYRTENGATNLTKDILNGNFRGLTASVVADYNRKLKKDEFYWNHIALPMLEQFLTHIKNIKERLLKKVNETKSNDSPIKTKKVVITIETIA